MSFTLVSTWNHGITNSMVFNTMQLEPSLIIKITIFNIIFLYLVIEVKTYYEKAFQIT